jgi:antitoxin component YwqK of YwqJK toxin-antitoxin module
MKNKIKFYLIGSLILFCCCNGPEVEIINLSTQNGPFKIIGNQDSITAKYNKKLFTGTAIENFGNKQPKLIAEFRHGVLHGKLRKYNSDGKLILEYNSKKGFIEGPLSAYHNNGNIKEISNFKNGKINGKSKLYFENGFIKKELYYLDGQLNGTLKSYYQNGKTRELRYYKKDLGNGTWEEYDSLGFITKKTPVINGKYTGVFSVYKYDENKKIIEESIFNKQDGILEGLALVINKNKDTSYIANYKNGKLEGEVKIILNNKGDYSITNYSNGSKFGNTKKYKSTGERIFKKKTFKKTWNLNPNRWNTELDKKSHTCSYCYKTFYGKGYYLAGTRKGIELMRSNNENQELCCSSRCANKIMNM